MKCAIFQQDHGEPGFFGSHVLHKRDFRAGERVRQNAAEHVDKHSESVALVTAHGTDTVCHMRITGRVTVIVVCPVKGHFLVLAAKIESEIAELETYEERQMFLEELGLQESGVNRLIKAAYALLNLRTFLTAGSDEVRAWTFKAGAKAPQCAGVIHTDFERGFIRAEVIKYDDFIALGGEAQCRAAGKLATEGKDYVVQDGDIMHFLFNV